MGILDRIAGTLDELTGDGRAAIADEIARARALGAEGDPTTAEALLVQITRRAPDAAEAFLALGELRAGRGALEEAIAPLGRAVDLDGGYAAAWCALGEALAGLGRTDPARDALRRTLTLALDDGLRRRATAALGRVHAAAGKLSHAARELRKAIEMGGPDSAEDRRLALDYGRVLARLGEREASEWLTRAARAENADPAIFAEAAAAVPDERRAEALLREGLARAPGDISLQAALVGFFLRTARVAEALVLAESSAAAAPDDPRSWAATREAAARAGRWRLALEAAARETALGAPPPPEARVALALGAEDRDALVALARAEPSLPAVGAFVDGRATETDLLRLGRLAPDETSRRLVARAGAPGAPPVGQLAGLLSWAHEFASGTPALVALATATGRAAEAFDRPLLVAVMGEFNAGKSSFVNALCGAEVAPTGVTPTTATINVLRFGATPEARVVHHDGSARTIPAADIAAFLATLRDADAREVRMVEIFLPVETLRRVEIVDTPGLNSIRPEHERVARDFLRDADAIVWVFAAGQAAKATEREALALAHAAGKRVVGVLNKIDRAEPGEVSALVRHVEGTLGDLVDPVVPFSATRAAAAQKAGRADAALEALTAVLEHRFLADARELKRATATAALTRFVESARAAAPVSVAPDLEGGRRALEALAQRLQSALDAERIALGARIEEGYRRAAFEVREFVQPRSWLFGEHRATAADEEFLAELLEDAVAQAADGTRAALRAALQPATTPPMTTAPTTVGGEDPAQTAKLRARVARAIEAALERFAAYARGVIEGGAVPDFFRHQLPRLKLEIAAIRDVLLRRAPAPEEQLFVGLKRDLDAAFKDARAALGDQATDETMRALIHDERIRRPLDALARAVDALSVS
ncbi:MAG TPA: dynamin family protein [Polyangia bacterium]|nr:dynamin family protein [Polyangia bacterium]